MHSTTPFFSSIVAPFAPCAAIVVDDFPCLFPARRSCRRHQKLEQLRTFRLAGHSIRRGLESDTTAVPALIPIPQGFGSGKVRHTFDIGTKAASVLLRYGIDATVVVEIVVALALPWMYKLPRVS